MEALVDATQRRVDTARTGDSDVRTCTVVSDSSGALFERRDGRGAVVPLCLAGEFTSFVVLFLDLLPVRRSLVGVVGVAEDLPVPVAEAFSSDRDLRVITLLLAISRRAAVRVARGIVMGASASFFRSSNVLAATLFIGLALRLIRLTCGVEWVA